MSEQYFNERRTSPMPIVNPHAVTGRSLAPPFPAACARGLFAMGCFWGAERLFWDLPGVYVTAVGYAAGSAPHPSYSEVCSGHTGHSEVVQVIYYPDQIGYTALLAVFWHNHDPTQGMRQGNDIGSQYRSGIYTENALQQQLAMDSKIAFQQRLDLIYQPPRSISTEIKPVQVFYYAEDEHQQYLAKHPSGYCALRGLLAATGAE